MIGRSFTFRGYGASVRVDVPDDVRLTDLRRQVAPELSAEEDAHGPPDLHLTRWEGVYRLVAGERRYGPYSTLENAFRGLSNGIHFLLGKRSPMTFLHAGAIELDGSAIVFPGRSRWGKSTLVASLVEQGCGYLSDEYAVVSPDGSVFPLSKPIRLRLEGGKSEFRTPPGVSAPGGLACAAMLLTRYETGMAWKPEPLTAGSAMLGVLPSALQSRDAPDQVLQAITALVRDAACYRGTRGDGEPSIDTLRQLNHSALEESAKQGIHA